MQTRARKALTAATAGLLASLAVHAQAQDGTETGAGSDQDHGHEHDHDPGHDHGHDHAGDGSTRQEIYDGYFEDDEVRQRPLDDWAGDWQSVYPYLTDGTLQPVMQHKAETGERSAEAYRAYYETGYETDVDRLTIEDGTVTFTSDDGSVSGTYADDGHEILTYEAGNRGVRYVFEKSGGDDAAPAYIQFSDHRIAPEDSGHFHLYWGDDRAALLQEVTNWPTYYPASLGSDEIVDEMLAH